MDIYAQDPDLESLRIPFVDGEQVIDVKLGFMVELDDNNNKIQYAIGIPFDACAAITIETQNGAQIQNISPDDDSNDEHTELMEIMAGQLQEQVGPDLQLIKSPRVLTIAGPLEKYTANWKEQALPQSLTAEELLNTEDEDVESFLAFMKEELGEEEFTKTMNEEHTFDEETMALFNIPGMGEQSDSDDFEQFLKNELKVDSGFPDREEEKLRQVLGDDMDHDGVALKLVSYGMPDGKKYSLVKLENPVILVAKQIGTEKAPQFELLSPEETKLVTPRLEEVCKDDLDRLGLLAGGDGVLNNEESTTSDMSPTSASTTSSFGPGPDSHALLKEVFPALLVHEKEYGNPNIPLGTTEGRICETLRRLQIQKKLSDSDVALLESMGFRWHSLEDVYRTADFDELLTRLVQYKQDNEGDVSPPKKYPQDPELGAWVTGIRRVGRDNIPQEQINQLEGIGFEWVSKRKCGSSFMTQYRQIKEEVEAAEGDPMLCFKNSANAKWLKAQQQAHAKKALSSTRVHYMEELLGDDWDTLVVD